MKNIPKVDLKDIPLTDIVAVVTDEPDYEMSRIMYVDDWPEYGDHTIVEGGHCSCYGFDDTEWTGVSYTSAELKDVAAGWLTKGDKLEREIAPFVIRNL